MKTILAVTFSTLLASTAAQADRVKELVCAPTFNDVYQTYVNRNHSLKITNESGFWGKISKQYTASLKAACRGSDVSEIIRSSKFACERSCATDVDSYFKPKGKIRSIYVKECGDICDQHAQRIRIATNFASEMQKDLDACRRSKQTENSNDCPDEICEKADRVK